MGIKVKSIAFKNEFRNESVDWLLANIGEKITIEIEIDVETSVISSVDNPFIYRNTDGYIGTTTEGWITDAAERFSDIKIGDTIILHNYSTTSDTIHTVLDKLNDGAIYLSNSGGANNQILSVFAISVSTPITAVRYKWNFVENDESPTFESKIDSSIQEALIKYKLASDTGSSAMEFLGSKCYQIGDVSIEGVNIVSTGIYKSTYKITHETYITPFMLSEQWGDLLNGIAPDYFLDAKCLKGIFDFEAQYDYNDPNRIQTEQLTEVLGNTGWFNENFNNVATKYSVDSVVIKNNLAEVIDAIELTEDETDIEIVIKNTSDSPFSNNNTKFTLNFCKAPEAETEYQGNGKTQDENFLFDRAIQTVGSAAVDGDNFGGSRQVLKTIEGQFISSSEIKITAKVALSSQIIAALSSLNSQRYLIWVTVQNHAMATKLADKVSLLIDANDFYIDNSDDGLIAFDSTKFLIHPESDPLLEGSDVVSAFNEDEIVAYTTFILDLNTRLDDEIIMKSLTCKLKAKNSSTNAEFNLDNFDLNLQGFPFIGDAQFADFELQRPFKIPDTEIRKTITFKSRTDLNGVNTYYFESYFPFLVRWEYWVQLMGVNAAFFDTGEPLNGFNNFWYRFTTLANWGFYFEFELKMLKNGEILSYNWEKQIELNDYDSNPDWYDESIKAYDPDTNALLYDGGTLRNFILGYKYTRIEAIFKTVNTIPSLANFYMVFRIETFEEGGVFESRRISSLWPIGNNDETWWLSIDGSNKIKMTMVDANTIKGEAYLNHNSIPLSKKKFKITARIYDLNVYNNKVFQDGVKMLFQDGSEYIFQDQ